MKLIFSLIILFISQNTSNAQWVLSNNGLSNTGVFCFAQLGNKLFVGTNISVDVSIDNADSWTQSLGPMFPVLTLVTNGPKLFAGAGQGEVWLSTDSGASWNPAKNGLPQSDVFSLVIHDTLMFAATSGSGVYMSANDGGNWTPVNTGLTSLDVRTIAVIGTTLFAGTFDKGIFISTNNGTNWTPANVGIPANEWIRNFLISGTEIFAATQSGVYHSLNDGTSWSHIDNGIPNPNVMSLMQSGQLFFAGTESHGIYLSVDNGSNWTECNTGFPSFGIAFGMAANATHIFSAMYSEGVYRRLISEITGMQEISNGMENITIYPNPASKEFRVESVVPITIGMRKDSQLEIFNSVGEKIYSAPFNELTTVDCKHFPKGLYFVRLCSDNQNAAQKLVVE